jgi:hypothetical protein
VQLYKLSKPFPNDAFGATTLDMHTILREKLPIIVQRGSMFPNTDKLGRNICGIRPRHRRKRLSYEGCGKWT